MIVQRFNLNLIPNQSPVVVHVNQYDTGTGRLIATLYEGNEPYSPSGTAVIQGTKPDGHGFQYTATLDGNVVTADLTEQMSPVAGDVRTQIVVTESSGVTGTFVFIMRVQPSALPSDTDMSESDYPLIEEAIREAQEAVERAEAAITETQENAEDSEAWAQGTRGGIPVEPTDPTYEHNAEYWAQYAERYAQGGLHYKASIPFANIPTTGMREGDMYDITDDFTTDSRFTEGAGIKVKGGTNIAWNSDNKWDILALPYIPKTTFNGRSGSILPMAGDYDSRKILLSSILHIGGETQNDVQEALEALSNDGVKSFNGRSGSVLPMAGDYDSEKILLASVLHIGGETRENVQEALEALEGNKADRVDNAIADNFAGLDANGNLKDSGKKASDFATPSDIAGQQSLLKDTVGWTGKNLLPIVPNSTINYVGSGSSSGLRLTYNVDSDGCITCSGSDTKDESSIATKYANSQVYCDLEPGNYILSLYIKTAATSNVPRFELLSSTNSLAVVTDTNTSKSFTLSAKTRVGLFLKVRNGSYGFMIRRADITDPTYEPYHESVEEEIEQVYAGNGVLGAKNLCMVTANTQTLNGVTFTVNRDSDGNVINVTVNGTASAVTVLILGTRTYLQNTYTLSGCPSGGNQSNSYALQVRDTNNTAIIYDEGNGGTRALSGGTEYRIIIRIANGYTANNLVFYPMLRLASDPDDTYQPYAMTNRELTEEKINIADLKTVVSASSDFADFKTRIASL